MLTLDKIRAYNELIRRVESGYKPTEFEKMFIEDVQYECREIASNFEHNS